MAVTLGVNRKRIQRLMRILGIGALYPKPNLSRPAAGHEVYPYLLKGVSIERPLNTNRCPIRGQEGREHADGRESTEINRSPLRIRSDFPEVQPAY
jgi:hypothetical protein